MSRDPNTPETFWENVHQSDACWEWLGKIKPDGYVQYRLDGKNQYIHRIAWELTYGTVPGGLFVLHKCDNRRCCNPNHLFLGTHQDNMDDMKEKWRQSQGYTHSMIVQSVAARGENNGFSKLTAAKVIQIRQLSSAGIAGTDIAKRFNISKNNVYSIVNRKTWRGL